MADYNWTPTDKRPLSPLACKVLHVLWQRKRQEDGSTARIDDVRDLVAAEFQLGLAECSRNSVKKVLNELKAYGIVQCVMMRFGAVGAPSATFRLAPGTVVTRPTSAAIILKLYNHPNEPVEEDLFIAEVHRLGLEDPAILTADRIREEITYAISRQYIERLDAPRPVLGKGPRVDYERGFLELISRRPPGSATVTIPSDPRKTG